MAMPNASALFTKIKHNLHTLGQRPVLEMLSMYYLAKDKIKKGFEKAKYTYDQLDTELKRLPPHELYINEIELENELKNSKTVEFGAENHFGKTTINFHQSPQPAFNKKFDLLAQNLKENTQAEYKNFIFSENANQIKRLEDIFDTQLLWHLLELQHWLLVFRLNHNKNCHQDWLCSKLS